MKVAKKRGAKKAYDTLGLLTNGLSKVVILTIMTEAFTCFACQRLSAEGTDTSGSLALC